MACDASFLKHYHTPVIHFGTLHFKNEETLYYSAGPISRYSLRGFCIVHVQYAEKNLHFFFEIRGNQKKNVFYFTYPEKREVLNPPKEMRMRNKLPYLCGLHTIHGKSWDHCCAAGAGSDSDSGLT